jgi:Endonuclease/Exonuclease/phosphatase family
VTVGVALALVAAACSGPATDRGADPATTTTARPTSDTAESTTTTPPASSPTTAPATAPTTDVEVEVATINVLHGLNPPISGCAVTTDQCQAPVRTDILWNYLEGEVGCPEIIALQEISPRWFEIIPEKLPTLCDGTHVLLTDDLGLFDQEMILTTLPVLDDARIELAGAPVWSAHWAQLDAGAGLTVDVFATHYASSSFDPPCSADSPATTCRPSCPVGSTLGDCHPFETLDILAERGAPGSLQLVIGDLNAEVDDPRIRTLLDAGFVDTHLAADNGECEPANGANCTSGIGGDTDLDGLDIAEQTPDTRIDFILARPPGGCVVIVDVGDEDGDGTTTGLWADTPLAEPIAGLYWASDHTGVQADIGLDCT